MDIASLGIEIRHNQAKAATKTLSAFGGAAKRAENSVSSLGRSAVGAFARLASLAASAFAVRGAFEFQSAISEVSTLVDEATFNMRGLEQAAIDQSAAFGGSATTQAKAFYQIISAGAKTASEANNTLTVANKLAVGGVTSVTVAADGLTSVLNAYGDKAGTATDVSDSLFVAMRAGKTTVGELAGALGRVAPLAAQTGVGFDELTAAISALTKGGIATSEATTGVRAILAAVAKPTKEASDLAKSLGINFSTAALETKGFGGFIDELVTKTGGSTDALAVLFGGVEALVPVMALSGQAGKDFTDIMGQMGSKAGATEEAFAKMAASPAFQAARLWSSLRSAVLLVTNQVVTGLVPAMKALADRFSSDAFMNFAGMMGNAVVTALNLAGQAFNYAYNYAEDLYDLFQIFVTAKIVGYIAILGRTFLNLAIVIKKVGIIMALFTSLSRVNITVMAALAAIVAKATGYYEGFEASIKSVFETAKNLLPDSWQKGIDDTVASIKTFDIDSKRLTDNFLGLDKNASAVANSFGDVSASSRAADAAVAALGDTTTKAKEKLDQSLQFSRELAGGFLSDLRGGLEQGKSLWSSFADAAVNALDKITDRILNQVLDAVFQVNNAGGSSGGGFLSSIFGGLFGGGSSGGSPMNLLEGVSGFRAAGGPVNSGQDYIVGENGPERFRPNQSGTIIPNGGSSGGAVQVPPAQIQVNLIGGDGSEKVSQRQEGNLNIIDIVKGEVRSDIAQGGMDSALGNRFGATPNVRRR